MVEFQFDSKELEDPAKVSELCAAIVCEIKNGNYTLCKLSENLEKFLVSQNEAQRTQGTEILSSVLEQIPSDLLSEAEVISFLQFFCDRLKDHFLVVPSALKGVAALVVMKNFPADGPEKVLLSLSQHVTCQALTQASRMTVYTLLNGLMRNQTISEDKIRSEVVFAVISAMDSERDPRNLLYLFNSLLPFLYSNFKLNHFAEEAFNVLECYFPVDFTPRSEFGITREILAEGLENCMSGSKEFCSLIIPTIVEKLESKLEVAHKDSLKLLIRVLVTWRNIEMFSSENLLSLWSALKELVLPGYNASVTQLASQALSEIVFTFASSSLNADQSNLFYEFLNAISSEAHRFLRDPSLTLFGAATKIHGTLALASHASASFCISLVVPQLVALLNSTETSYKSTVLIALIPLLRSSIKYNLWSEDETKNVEILSSVPEALLDSLKIVQARSVAYECFTEISSILNSDCRNKLYSALLKFIPSEQVAVNRDSCSKLVQSLASGFPNEMKDLILHQIDLNNNNERNLDVFLWTCKTPSLSCYATDKLVSVCTSTSPRSPLADNCLSRLRKLCEDLETESNVVTFNSSKDNLITKLLTFFITSSWSEEKFEPLVHHVAVIVDATMRSLDEENQEIILDHCLPLFNGFLSRGDSTYPPSSTIVLLEGLLASLRPSLVNMKCSYILPQLLLLSLSSEKSYGRTSAARLAASLVNKSFKENEQCQSLDNYWNDVVSKSNNGSVPATESIAWITKGLALQAHPETNKYLKHIMLLLTSSCQPVQRTAANAFKILLTDDRFMCRESFCSVKLLYKQRIFQSVSDLIKMFNSLNQTERVEERTSVAIAVANLLNYSPRQLVLERIKELAPVMALAINNNSIEATSNLLSVISNCLEAKEPVMIEYIDTFISQCLSCTTNPCMDVRMKALDCLYYYGKYPETNLLPLRTKVIRGLANSLDDKKRLVRQKAVRARSKWFLIGSM